MNRCVPEFETEEDRSIPSSSGLTRPKTIGEEEIMELLWKNGQVVVQTQTQNQNQRPPEKTTPLPQLFMQDDEMTSWLQYPLDDFCTDLWPPPPGLESRICGVTSSAGDSGGSLPSKAVTVTDDRKRKGREEEVTECQSDDVEFESADGKKQVCGSTSSKKSRAAEVHNLSERRRRDRINEKMKALQELVPRSNKSDKASMLDEAIEYLKTLQLQVQQMMSMGCNMVPVMFPGVQQYVQPMGMGMGLSMGMNRPMLPFLPGSAMQNPAAAAHLGPRFRMPTFRMPPVPGPDPSRIPAIHLLDPRFNPLVSQNPNQQQISNFANAYQQYLGLHQARVPLPQNQSVVNPSTSKPCSSREAGNPENH